MSLCRDMMPPWELRAEMERLTVENERLAAEVERLKANEREDLAGYLDTTKRLEAEVERLRAEVERLKNRPIGQVKLDGPVW